MSQAMLSLPVYSDSDHSGCICLYANCGSIKVNTAPIRNNKNKSLIPLVDETGRWIALLRIEQQFRGVRIRTEVLDQHQRACAGSWVEATDDTNIELNWDIDESGKCKYLSMSAY